MFSLFKGRLTFTTSIHELLEGMVLINGSSVAACCFSWLMSVRWSVQVKREVKSVRTGQNTVLLDLRNIISKIN